MIRELGNVELFELCETLPEVQCSYCFLDWNQGIVYCTCGQCLIDSASGRKVNHLRLDALFYPGLRDQERVQSWCSTWQNRRTERVPKSLECVEEMLWESRLSRWIFLQVFTIEFSEIQFVVNHNSQSDGQNKKCKEWDERAKEDHTDHLTPEECWRYQGQWYLTLNKSGKHGPRKVRSDYRAAVLMKNRLHPESGEKVEEPIFSRTIQDMASLFKHIVVGQVWMELVELMRHFQWPFCYSWFRLQSMSIHCNRREV